jgi:hypothetical protein
LAMLMVPTHTPQPPIHNLIQPNETQVKSFGPSGLVDPQCNH